MLEAVNPFFAIALQLDRRGKGITESASIDVVRRSLISLHAALLKYLFEEYFNVRWTEFSIHSKPRQIRLRLLSGLAIVSLEVFVARFIVAQETRVPPTSLQPVPMLASNPNASPALPSSSQAQAGTVKGPDAERFPSLEARPALPSSDMHANASRASSFAPTRVANVVLPTSAGQYWMEYDLRPYTQSLKNVDRPQQSIVDWIIRDTGTDVWFGEPTGILSADRTTLRVYHNEGMQQVVKQVYERFVNGPMEPQLFSLRIITIANPNWRQRALAWMRSVEVDSPGIHGWLLSKENSAMLMSMLRSRTDVRETPLPDLPLVNGQSHNIDQLRSRNYVREYTRQEQPYPAYVPVNKELQEGYRLQLSPLMSTDLRTLDVALKCSIDQVEKLNQVSVDLPTATGGMQSAVINVPQMASWRLQERFRWPSDQVLVLSCGVIAAPTQANEGTLLNTGNGNGLFGLGRLLPNQAGARADALLVIEYRGPAGSSATTNTSAGTIAAPPSPSLSRGRY
jgi:hypothetical protein